MFPSHVINPLFTKNVPFDPIDDFAPDRTDRQYSADPRHASGLAGQISAGSHRACQSEARSAHVCLGRRRVGRASVRRAVQVSDQDGHPCTSSTREMLSALNDVLGGHVSMMFDTITTGLTARASNGKLNMLAVTTAHRAVRLRPTRRP